jgi:hypothetical protein
VQTTGLSGGGSAGGALELRGAADGLLDEPLALTVRGAGGGPLLWRARLRDDDGRVWRAAADEPELLAAAWAPAKETTGAVAALRSLRPVALDLRAEAADGRAAARTVRRRLVADGVRVRRWRAPLPGALLLPDREEPCAAVVVEPAPADAPAAPGAPGDPAPSAPRAAAGEATLSAAALLASRGVLVFATTEAGAGDQALELLAAVPAAARAARPARRLAFLPLPPGIPARLTAAEATANAVAWDALLAELGAGPRA